MNGLVLAVINTKPKSLGNFKSDGMLLGVTSI